MKLIYTLLIYVTAILIAYVVVYCAVGRAVEDKITLALDSYYANHYIDCNN